MAYYLYSLYYCFAFLSLIFSGIKPIIDFGWMMTFGLITSFIITFTLLPTLLNFAPTKNMSLKKEQNSKITNFLGIVALNNKNTVLELNWYGYYFKCNWN